MEANSQFDAYAAFYDLLYKDKDYAGEADYIHLLIEKYSSKKADEASLLDLACGTGKHLIELQKKGYSSLSGSDISKSMIEIAKRNSESKSLPLTFYNCSFQESHKINKAFDVIISMFSAMNYLTNYEDQSKTLRNIHSLLKTDGLFIFDFWNGCAVTEYYSPVKVLRKKENNVEILRISETCINLIEQSATVKFICNYFNNDKRIADFEETHSLHYYYFSEIRNLLVSHGFKILHMSPFMRLNEEVAPEEWNISLVCRKITKK